MNAAFLAQLTGRPLALAPRALDGLLAAAVSPESRSGRLPALPEADRAAPGYALAEGGIAVAPILGPLVTRSDWLTAFLGATNYDEVAGAIAAAFADPSSRAVLLEIDSPGGEAGGLFDLVDAITTLRAEVGKPHWAVARESALSAAYAVMREQAGRVHAYAIQASSSADLIFPQRCRPTARPNSYFWGTFSALGHPTGQARTARAGT